MSVLWFWGKPIALPARFLGWQGLPFFRGSTFYLGGIGNGIFYMALFGFLPRFFGSWTEFYYCWLWMFGILCSTFNSLPLQDDLEELLFLVLNVRPLLFESSESFLEAAHSKYVDSKLLLFCTTFYGCCGIELATLGIIGGAYWFPFPMKSLYISLILYDSISKVEFCPFPVSSTNFLGGYDLTSFGFDLTWLDS